MDSMGNQSFLEMLARWGLPMPGQEPAPPAPTPFLPGAGPDAMAGAMPLSGMPMPAPVMPTAPVTETAPASSYAPAAFQPPPQIAANDQFGRFMQTIGARTPAAATPQAAMPRTAAGRQMLQPQTPPRYLQAQQGGGYPGGGGMPVQPRKPPLPPIHPSVARRYPGSARMQQLFDGVRRNKGLI